MNQVLMAKTVLPGKMAPQDKTVLMAKTEPQEALAALSSLLTAPL
jgi:hypothetical protein